MKHQIIQVTQPPCSQDLVPFDFWLFPKLKSPLKGKKFQTVYEIQENMMGQLMAIGRTVWYPKVPTLKGTKAWVAYVQCLLYLVSSSTNVSIFHSTWMDTFWTDLTTLSQVSDLFVLAVISWCQLRHFSTLQRKCSYIDGFQSSQLIPSLFLFHKTLWVIY